MSLKVVEYDTKRGMERQKDGTIDIRFEDGTLHSVKDVVFYDLINGYIQTGDTLYCPINQGKLIANHQD